MDMVKHDYYMGLVFFLGLIICIFSFFTAPDGVAYFDKFLGLFGISPGIPIGAAGTLYIYGIIPLGLGIFCGKKLYGYLRDYKMKFGRLNPRLHILPALAVIFLFWVSSAVQPSLIDRVYFFTVSRHDGLRAITVSVPNPRLTYEDTGDSRIYTYDMMLSNHGSETKVFNVRLSYEEFWRGGFNEVLVRDESGNIKIFTLPPRQTLFFWGEFAVYHETSVVGFGSVQNFSIVLANENETHSPNFLIRRNWW